LGNSKNGMWSNLPASQCFSSLSVGWKELPAYHTVS